MGTLFRAKFGCSLLGTLCLVAFGATPAFADHFEPNSKKVCGSIDHRTGEVACTLTIAINDEVGLEASEDISVDLDPGSTGASFESAIHAGGTCTGQVSVTAEEDELTVSPQAPGRLNNCVILIQEVLTADHADEICQTVDSPFNDPPLRLCAQITEPPPPTTKEECKQGEFRRFGIFKNQGDCVSFVATNGKNEPGKNQPE